MIVFFFFLGGSLRGACGAVVVDFDDGYQSIVDFEFGGVSQLFVQEVRGVILEKTLCNMLSLIIVCYLYSRLRRSVLSSSVFFSYLVYFALYRIFGVTATCSLLFVVKTRDISRPTCRSHPQFTSYSLVRDVGRKGKYPSRYR